MRPSSKCAIVVSFYPHVTLEFNFYINNVLFFFFFTIQNLLCVFFYLLYYLSMSWLFIQDFFRCSRLLLVLFDFLVFFLFFSFLFLHLFLDQQPTNSSTQLVVQNNRNILFLFYSIALQIMIFFMTLTCNEKYEPTSSIYVCKLLFK